MKKIVCLTVGMLLTGVVLCGCHKDEVSADEQAKMRDAIKGKNIQQTAKQAAAQIRTVARPMSLNAYKIDLVQGLIERTILQALG